MESLSFLPSWSAADLSLQEPPPLNDFKQAVSNVVNKGEPKHLTEKLVVGVLLRKLENYVKTVLPAKMPGPGEKLEKKLCRALRLEHAAPTFFVYSLSDVLRYLRRFNVQIKFVPDVEVWFSAARNNLFEEPILCERQKQHDFSRVLATMRRSNCDSRTNFELMCAHTNYRVQWFSMIESGELPKLLKLIIERNPALEPMRSRMELRKTATWPESLLSTCRDKATNAEQLKRMLLRPKQLTGFDRFVLPLTQGSLEYLFPSSHGNFPSPKIVRRELGQAWDGHFYDYNSFMVWYKGKIRCWNEAPKEISTEAVEITPTDCGLMFRKPLVKIGWPEGFPIPHKVLTWYRTFQHTLSLWYCGDELYVNLSWHKRNAGRNGQFLMRWARLSCEAREGVVQSFPK